MNVSVDFREYPRIQLDLLKRLKRSAVSPTYSHLMCPECDFFRKKIFLNQSTLFMFWVRVDFFTGKTNTEIPLQMYIRDKNIYLFRFAEGENRAIMEPEIDLPCIRFINT